MRLPNSSTRPLQLGSKTTVLSDCSRIAGPRTCCPAPSVRRSRTCTIRHCPSNHARRLEDARNTSVPTFSVDILVAGRLPVTDTLVVTNLSGIPSNDMPKRSLYCACALSAISSIELGRVSKSTENTWNCPSYCMLEGVRDEEALMIDTRPGKLGDAFVSQLPQHGGQFADGKSSQGARHRLHVGPQEVGDNAAECACHAGTLGG